MQALGESKPGYYNQEGQMVADQKGYRVNKEGKYLTNGGLTRGLVGAKRGLQKAGAYLRSTLAGNETFDETPNSSNPEGDSKHPSGNKEGINDGATQQEIEGEDSDGKNTQKVQDTPPSSFKETITQKKAEVKSLQTQLNHIDAMTDSEVADGLVKDIIKFYIPEDKIDLK